MNSITTDASWRQLFASATGVTPVHDSEGRLLGYFSPVYSANAAEYEAIAARNDTEEMKRRREYDGKWFSTAEVLEHLKSLGK
ncbi:MAG TPA: hypothetical protein PKE20_10690 [Promineifilum sp.]|nr:hypothetical protein [Promineifilum sp.]